MLAHMANQIIIYDSSETYFQDGLSGDVFDPADQGNAPLWQGKHWALVTFRHTETSDDVDMTNIFGGLQSFAYDPLLGEWSQVAEDNSGLSGTVAFANGQLYAGALVLDIADVQDPDGTSAYPASMLVMLHDEYVYRFRIASLEGVNMDEFNFQVVATAMPHPYQYGGGSQGSVSLAAGDLLD